VKRNPGVIRFSEKDFAKYAPKIKGLSGGSSRSSSGHTKKRGRRFKKAGLFSGAGFLGLGRSKQRISVRNGEPMKQPTAKQKRARSKNKNHPSKKQLAARRKFALMSKRRARERKAALRGVVNKVTNRKPGKSRNTRGKKKASVTRPGKKTGARSTNPQFTAREERQFKAIKKSGKKRYGKRATQVAARTVLAHRSNKSKRRNSAVNEVFRTFVGRDSHNIVDVDFPDGSPTNLAQLGVLVELKSETETFRFEESERVFLAADGRGNLYVGGKQQPVEPNTSFGKLLGLSYVTKKAHIEPGRTIEYVHKFGDEGGKCPTLRSDKEGRFIIKGGTYTVTSAGIAD
jgi:hypothetical protein